MPMAVSVITGTKLVALLLGASPNRDESWAPAGLKYRNKMVLKAGGPGYVSKTFFEKGTHVREGDPLAIVVCDPEDGPRSAETSKLEVIENIRNKPGSS